MNCRHSFTSVLVVFALLCSFNFRVCWSMDWFSTCRTSRFSCGNIIDVDYPFWGNGRPDRCEHPQLKLSCEDNLTTVLEIMSVKYHVLELDQSTQILKIARTDFLNGICSPEYGNTAFNSTPFEYAPDSYNLILFYDCWKKSSYFSDRYYFTCRSGSAYKNGYVLSEPKTEIGICNSSVTIAVPAESFYKVIGNWSMLEGAIREGFEVKYKVDSASCILCKRLGGACGYDWNSTKMACYCRNQPPGACLSTPVPLQHKTGSSLKHNLATGIAVPLSGIMIIVIVILAYWRKEKRNKFDVDAFIRNNQLFAPRRYSYSHLKKMTNSFAEKIGQGGYGTVYKGKLADERLVAVKVLSELNGNGEEFINEVTSMGRTSHVNIVSLLGFCYDKSKRALIYDYMPNGSLDKFIFNRGSLNTSPCLEWRVLYDIAIGVARGLEYLHRGCKTRILHFDIKPQNILLDKDFCPKISDFGLARLWLKDDSITSIMGARGTAGYIAPEVFSRRYGGVSHKSDVYSYGMLVLEMAGGIKKFESATSNTSEISYSYRMHEEAGNNTRIWGIASDEEKEISEKMLLVSFWCIQMNPADRPSMTKVVEMMEGSLESIEIPPKPFLFSPGKEGSRTIHNEVSKHHEHGIEAKLGDSL